jgi:hypothetical protein
MIETTSFILMVMTTIGYPTIGYPMVALSSRDKKSQVASSGATYSLKKSIRWPNVENNLPLEVIELTLTGEVL